MRIQTADFLTSAPDLASCPAPTVPEFALVGRSNVGKSSLLNLLTNRQGLARVSATPGHTSLLNFYDINKTFRLVDLPGYGFAKTLKDDPARFERLIVDYVTGREGLRCVLSLIDSRHEPHTMDVEFVRWMLQASAPVALVFTKTDKLKPAQAEKRIAEFLAAVSDRNSEAPPVFRTSSKDRIGHRELLDFLGGLLNA